MLSAHWNMAAQMNGVPVLGQMYYWDSYFIVQGLLVSNMQETAQAGSHGPFIKHP